MTITVLIEHDSSIIKTCNYNNIYPIHYSSFLGDVGTISLLLSHDGDIDIADGHGETPISVAAHNGQVRCKDGVSDRHS